MISGFSAGHLSSTSTTQHSITVLNYHWIPFANFAVQWLGIPAPEAPLGPHPLLWTALNPRRHRLCLTGESKWVHAVSLRLTLHSNNNKAPSPCPAIPLLSSSSSTAEPSSHSFHQPRDWLSPWQLCQRWAIYGHKFRIPGEWSVIVRHGRALQLIPTAEL